MQPTSSKPSLRGFSFLGPYKRKEGRQELRGEAFDGWKRGLREKEQETRERKGKAESEKENGRRTVRRSGRKKGKREFVRARGKQKE